MGTEIIDVVPRFVAASYGKMTNERIGTARRSYRGKTLAPAGGEKAGGTRSGKELTTIDFHF
jgi:hypothetical protein